MEHQHPSPKALGKRRAVFPSNDPLQHPALRVPSRSSALVSRYEAGFDFHCPLKGHTSCVNALSFSSHDGGQWLASGGDDKSVFLWRTSGNLSAEQPRGTYRGARSNIFTIDFTSDGMKLLSGGNDHMVLLHDIETGGTTSSSAHPPKDLWNHDAGVKRVCCHPQNPHLFLSAAEDGCIRSFDLRTDMGVVAILSEQAEFNDVAYNPLTPEVFAAADGFGRITLQDGRMAFAGSVDDSRVAKEVCVRQYATSLCEPIKKTGEWPPPTTGDEASFRANIGSFDSASLAFDSSGTYLCATITRYLPTLFDVSDEFPIATFTTDLDRSVETLPRGYSNTCTTKHGSFGGTLQDGLYYTAGSDDFRAYVWSVPPLHVLKDRRYYSGSSKPQKTERGNYIAFTKLTEEPEDEERYSVPTQVFEPSAVLQGHRSIVNTALFHPTLPLIFTSGVEKVIFAHSGSPFNPDTQSERTLFQPRERRGRGLPDPEETGSTTEDLGVLEYFDHLLIKDEERWLKVREGSTVFPTTLEDSDDEDDDSDLEDFFMENVLGLVPVDSDELDSDELEALESSEDEEDVEHDENVE
ncbi:WD40 repeat-like protein [Meredithblackwellia eburnea MCA 4105]